MATFTPNVESIYHRVGATIRELREASGQTQHELAKACDMRRGLVSHIEQGRRRVQLPELAKIAAALGLYADELLRRAAG